MRLRRRGCNWPAARAGAGPRAHVGPAADPSVGSNGYYPATRHPWSPGYAARHRRSRVTTRLARFGAGDAGYVIRGSRRPHPSHLHVGRTMAGDIANATEFTPRLCARSSLRDISKPQRGHVRAASSTPASRATASFSVSKGKVIVIPHILTGRGPERHTADTPDPGPTDAITPGSRPEDRYNPRRGA